MPESLGPGHAGASSRCAVGLLGRRKLWDTRANNHNAMFDEKGRVWLAATVRGHGQSGLVQEGLGQRVRQGLPAR